MSFVPLSADFQLADLAKGATLILPAVSTGNVPQLTIDLLLSSLAHTFVGSFHSAHVLPCAGHNAFDTPAAEGATTTKQQRKKGSAAASPTPLVTAVQVFSIPSLRLLVLQQRAPCVVGRAAAYVDELVRFAAEHSLARVVVLTSSLAYRQQEQELDNPTHPVSYYIIEEGAAAPAPASSSTSTPPAAAAAAAAASASSSSPLSTLLSSTLQWTSLHYNTLQQDAPPLRFDQLGAAEEVDEEDSTRGPRRGGGKHQQVAGEKNDDDDEKPMLLPPTIPVPGLGITRAFYTRAAQQPSLKSALPFATVFLHTYINEGANDRDAAMVAQNVYAMLFLLQQQASSTGADKSGPLDPREVAWRMPSSWSALFGNEPEESMYL